MTGLWFQRDYWNVLDFAVVFVSILAIPMSDVKGFNLLRMIRVFRVRIARSPLSSNVASDGDQDVR